MDAQRLHNDLCRAVDEARLPQVPTLQLYGMAAQLALVPGLAAAWARVLTEHTAPAMKTVPVYAEIEVHAYQPDIGGPGGRCGRWLDQLAARCGHTEDAAVHRIEELTPGQPEALARFADFVSQPGPPASSTDVERLRELGLIAESKGGQRFHVTTRGAEWLAAHHGGGHS